MKILMIKGKQKESQFYFQAEPDLIDLEADDAGDANGSAGAINDNDIECIDLSDDDNEVSDKQQAWPSIDSMFSEGY